MPKKEIPPAEGAATVEPGPEALAETEKSGASAVLIAVWVAAVWAVEMWAMAMARCAW